MIWYICAHFLLDRTKYYMILNYWRVCDEFEWKKTWIWKTSITYVNANTRIMTNQKCSNWIYHIGFAYVTNHDIHNVRVPIHQQKHWINVIMKLVYLFMVFCRCQCMCVRIAHSKTTEMWNAVKYEAFSFEFYIAVKHSQIRIFSVFRF